MDCDKPKIIFLNQTAGTLFQELAVDLAGKWSPSLLYSAPPQTACPAESASLAFKPAPRYQRKSALRRLFSWLHYFVGSFFLVAARPADSLLFIVSNPPFLGLIGLFFKLLRKQKYVVLVYDIYPDVLISLGTIGDGWLARVWRFFNRQTLRRADLVFTIGQDMAERLQDSCDLRGTLAGKAVVIPNWADIGCIKPLDKKANWFAARHGQTEKITVLYSGNMGNTHDIESILAVARKLRDRERIRFLFIGEGAKWALVEAAIREENLANVTLLPWQPEEVLPFSLTAGDIGIVGYLPGTEGCIVPSKTYYYMAAGLVPLVLCGKETDLSKMVAEHRCGVTVGNGKVEEMARAILQFDRDALLLSSYQKRSRAVAEQFFSRGNTALYLEALEKHFGAAGDGGRIAS
jgi:glycosyltransferase involved in cell wall biosynthesis